MINRIETVDEELRRADVEEAQHHGEASILRGSDGQYMSVCSTDTEELGKSSTGLELYFRFVKEMCLLFICMSLTSIPQLIFNYMGGQVAGNDQSTVFEGSTLANQKGISSTTTSQSAADSSVKDQTKYEYMTVYFDVSTCVIFLVLLHVFRIYNWRTELRSKSVNLSPANYAVQVLGLPRYMPRGAEDAVREFFESRFGPVAECVFAHEFGGALSTYKRIAALSREIKKEQLRCQLEGKPTSQALESLRKRRYETQTYLRKTMPNMEDYDSLPVGRAFVVFESPESRRKCLQVYSHCQFFGCLGCSCLQAEGLRYRHEGEQFRLEVGKVPSPGNLLWENLEASLGGRVLRGIISFICVVLLLAASYAAVYAIEEAQKWLPTQQDCEQYASETLEQAQADTNKDRVYCFCSNVDKIKVSFLVSICHG